MNTTSLRKLTLVAIVLAVSFLVPLTAHATAFIWTGGVDATWAQAVSPYNWSGGSSTNGWYPGMTHTTYTDTATITSTTNNPVTLASAITLGGTSPCLALSGASNSLIINSGGTVGSMSDISNFGTITINTGGILQDGATSSGLQYVLGLSSATGNVTLAGGTISSRGGTWVTEQSISGYGTISSPVINFTGGIITANNASPLNITGVFANGTSAMHVGTVNVGTSVANPTGTLTLGTGGTFTNYSALNIYGTLNNNTATTMTMVGTGGTATLAGGTLGGTGTFTNGATMSAYGNITAGLINSAAGTINVAGNITVSDITLNNTGNTTHGINLGAYTLDHSTAGTFALTGNGFTTLAGGSITNSGGGSMTNANTIRGYGTVSAPMTTNTGTITANTAGQTLTVTGNIATQSGTLSATAGNLLLESKITGTYGILAANSGAEVDLNGADLVGPTGLFAYLTLGSSSNGSGPINLTGDSTWENHFQLNSSAPLNVNGHTLTLVNFTGALPSSTFLNVGTGNLNIIGPAAVNSGGYIKLGGGNIYGNNASNTLSAGVSGYGDITAEQVGTGGQATASGGTMYVDGGSILNNGSSSGGLYSSSTGVLDIRSTISNPFNSFTMTGSITPNSGTVNLDGATLTTTGTDIISLSTGTVNVTNNSTFTGNVTSSSTLGINSGQTLTLSSATLTLAGGSLTSSGTLAVGANTVNNAMATTYTLGGGGAVTLAGGSFTSTGGGGFTSSNVVSGTGNIHANWTQTGAASSTSGTFAFTGNVAVNGGTFQGNHTITGNLTTGPSSNAILASHNGSGTGTMGVTGNVTLDPSTVLNYNLGTASDLITVSGALTAAGTVNVNALSGFGVGNYPLFSYGTLVSNTLTAGTTPGGYNYGFGLTNVGGVNYLDLIVSSLSTAYTFSVPNGNWGDYSSWNPTTGMPGAQDTATFNMGGNPTVMLNGTQTVQGVALSGSGSLMANDGPGTLTVTSAVTVGSGQTLHGSGHITAPTFNLNGGTLGGPLNLTGNVTSTGGQLTPGDAAVINIAGNLSLDHTSAVNLQLGAPAGPNDQIAVTGNIALDGTLNVTALTGFGAGSYTLLAATGTAGGTFANVTGIPAPAVDSRGFYIVYTGAVSIVSGNQVVLNVTLGGDTNRDGVLNSLDIDAIYQNMTVAPTSYQGTWPRALAAYQAQYDLNGDSVVNQDDVSYELQHYFLTNFGDGDMNHATDFQDFQILLNHWQATGPSVGWATADFNGDGVVDFLDFQMLLNYWNPGGWNISPSQVPEPASLTLILLGALGLVRRRSSR